jgi:hypothetical protein
LERRLSQPEWPMGRSRFVNEQMVASLHEADKTPVVEASRSNYEAVPLPETKHTLADFLRKKANTSNQ